MVIRVGYIKLKLTFQHGKLYENFGKLFFLSEDSREIYR